MYSRKTENFYANRKKVNGNAYVRLTIMSVQDESSGRSTVVAQPFVDKG